MKRYVTYNWNDSDYASEMSLNNSFMRGEITRQAEPFGEFRTIYRYSELDGTEIATFSKDNSFGFSSQATGVKLKTNSFRF